MTKIAAYSGWLGNNNIGDEALYLANRILFNDFELVNRKFYDNSILQLYGGGTVIPRQVANHNTDELVAAIGVGVESPEFRNQPFAPIDIDYFLANTKLDVLTENKYTRHVLDQISSMSNSIMMNEKYLIDSQFEPVHRFDYLGVRGPLSKEILTQYDIESQVIGDTALILEPSDYNQQSSNKIAVTLRSERGVLKWSNDTSYVQKIKEFCQAHSEEYDFVFIPFRPIDIPLHVKLSAAVDNAEFKDYCSYVDVRAVIDEISECDLVIGERLHANILAACSFTPFLSLGYQPKNIDFAKSVDMDEYHVRFHRVTHDWLTSRFKRITKSTDIQERLQSEVSNKRATIHSFTEDILEEIGELEDNQGAYV